MRSQPVAVPETTVGRDSADPRGIGEMDTPELSTMR